MADAPTISGTRAGQHTFDEDPIGPFSTVVISDPAAGATETLVILAGMPGEPGGMLMDGPGFDGLQQFPFDPMAHITSDRYELTGSPQQVTAETEALIHTPSAFRGTTSTLSLFVTSSSGAPTTGDGTTTVADLSPTGAVSLSPQTIFRDGAFTLTGTASSTAGVRSVEISAVVDGVATDLGAATVDANGSFSFADAIGPHTQGFITATETDDAGGTAAALAPYSLTGGLSGGKGEQDRHTADGSTETATDVFKANRSQKATLLQPGQVFASASFDTFDNGGVPLSTFVFDPGFGRDVVNLFRVDGTGHDTLSLKGSDFGVSIATALNNARDTKAGLPITDPTASGRGGGPGTHDTLLLKGITRDQLTQNRGDIAFHA